MRLILRRLGRVLFRVAAGVVIVVALLSLAARVAMPALDAHPEAAARVLTRYLHQPVTLGSLRGQWQATGPLLRVTDLRIGTGPEPLHLPRARLKVDFGAWLHRDRRLLELQLDGVDARIERDASGVWHLSGISLQKFSAPGEAAASPLPISILLRETGLVVHEAGSGGELRLRIPAMRIKAQGPHLRFGGVVEASGGGSLQLVGEADPGAGAGRLQLRGSELELAAWAAPLAETAGLVEGEGSLALWAAWRAGRVEHVTARLGLADLRFTTPDGRDVTVPRLQGLLRASGTVAAWRLGWQPAGEGPEAPFLAMERAASGELRVAARSLELGELTPWLGLAPAAGPWTVLAAAAPHGLLEALRLDWRGRQDFSLHGRLDGFGWQPAAMLPGVDHLDGEFRGDAGALSLELPTQAFTVSYPQVFREPFVFSRADGVVSAWLDADAGWRVATDDLDLVSERFTARVRGSLHADGERSLPVLDVAARALDAEVPAAKLFWPMNVMPPNAVTWLDRALAAGDVHGWALFRGNLGDWPFADGSGRFEAVGDFSSAVLDYDPDWPRADHLVGRARFINTSMSISASAGATLGNHARAARAEIPDFEHPELALEVEGAGDATRLLAWLRRTPVGKEHAAALAQISLAGRADFGFRLDLPLHDEAGKDLHLDGRVDLAEGSFRAAEWNFAVSELAGQASFDAGGVDVPRLDALYHGVPVRLAARIGTASHQPETMLEASMHGLFDVATLTADYPDLAPLARHMHGTSTFDIGLRLGAQTAVDEPSGQFSIDSDLFGIALDLPAPLRKAAPAQQHLHVELGLPRDGSQLHIRLGDVADAELRLPGEVIPGAGDVAFGGRADSPGVHGLHLHGAPRQLDLGAWLQLGADPQTGAGALPDLGPLSVDLQAEEAIIAGTAIGPLALRVLPNEGGMEIGLDGPAAAGQIRVPLANLAQRGITVELERLHWPQPAAEKAEDGAALAPAAVPPLHVWVGDLRFGAVNLGEVRVESVPVAGAMQVEQFSARSPELQISARGSWAGDAVASRSEFVGDLSAPDLGRMLEAFGYPRLIAGGATLLHLEGGWPGSPAGFGLDRLEGLLTVQVNDGRILEVEPGVGRLFGLFSIRELPRRLSLDFGDIFQSGYAFNHIAGSLRFADGSAWTDDLDMQGPAADLSIRGRTGLRDEDYDEQVTVTPRLGATLPVVGALAGGPAGAAAGLAVQGILGRGMNRAGETVYLVTGSWAEPEIRKFGRVADGPVPPFAAPPAGPATTAPATPQPPAIRPEAGDQTAPEPDTETPDATTPDATTPDATTPDATTPDATTPDEVLEPDAPVP